MPSRVYPCFQFSSTWLDDIITRPIISFIQGRNFGAMKHTTPPHPPPSGTRTKVMTINDLLFHSSLCTIGDFL